HTVAAVGRCRGDGGGGPSRERVAAVGSERTESERDALDLPRGWRAASRDALQVAQSLAQAPVLAPQLPELTTAAREFLREHRQDRPQVGEPVEQQIALGGLDGGCPHCPLRSSVSMGRILTCSAIPRIWVGPRGGQ